MPRILLVDDDPALREILSGYLRRFEYEVDTAKSVDEGEEKFSKAAPDLVLLDIMMPGVEGWQLLRTLRHQSDVPVIILTARSTEHDVLQGFALGSDDYVTKPFSFAQLEARIRARLKQPVLGQSDPNLLTAGDIVVDLNAHRVTKDTRIVALTPAEFGLLTALMRQPGKVFSVDQLVGQIWGPEYAGGGEYIRRYVWHLRRKLEDNPTEPRYIRNERALGYYFDINGLESAPRPGPTPPLS